MTAVTRRQLLGAAAAGTFAAGALIARPRPAAATVTPNPFVRHFLLGASVTRLANSATDTKDRPSWHIPYCVVDAHDGRGLTVSATDGAPNLVDAFLAKIALGPTSGLRPDDWVVFDWTLGTEDLTAAAAAVDVIVARCIADGYRLGWVLPRVAYGAMTTAQQQWNDDARAMLTAKVPTVPISALVDWPRLVETWTLITPGLTQAQKDVAAPLLYDGRHPTGATTTNPGRGCERWSMAVAAAVGY